MEETKVLYHIDEEKTPYLIKIPISPEKVCLLDLKNALNKHNFKYFFKSEDDDFGIVKEEITDDDSNLPYANGRVICWLVSSDGSTLSDSNNSVNSSSNLPRNPLFMSPVAQPETIPENEAIQSGPHKAEINNNSRHPINLETDTLCESETEGSVYGPHQDRVPPLKTFSSTQYRGLQSDMDSTSYFDSGDDSSIMSSTTYSSHRYNNHHYHHPHHHNQKTRAKHRRKKFPISRASSFSSVTESSMTLNIVTVQLDMQGVGFLGISIVGQSNRDSGNGGFYVGSIMKGGAVAQDGRIEPGDMILEVNNISFENMSNEEAVRTLREQVHSPGPITLVVAKCWNVDGGGGGTLLGNSQNNGIKGDNNNRNNPTDMESVRPIDPRMWLLHTNAHMEQDMLQQQQNGAVPNNNNNAQTGSVITTSSSLPDYDNFMHKNNRAAALSLAQQQPSGGVCVGGGIGLQQGVTPICLNKDMDYGVIVKAMMDVDSGLEVRDRLWLKIVLTRAFIGSDLVDWLFHNVQGFFDRKAARKYASLLLKRGLIKHTVNKVSFSEQCYYTFGDVVRPLCSGTISNENSLEEIDSVSQVGANATGKHPHLGPQSVPGPNLNPLNHPLQHQVAPLPPSAWQQTVTTSLTAHGPNTQLSHHQQQLINPTSSAAAAWRGGGPLELCTSLATPTNNTSAGSNGGVGLQVTPGSVGGGNSSQYSTVASPHLFGAEEGNGVVNSLHLFSGLSLSAAGANAGQHLKHPLVLQNVPPKLKESLDHDANASTSSSSSSSSGSCDSNARIVLMS